jgi:hypothetical protein
MKIVALIDVHPLTDAHKRGLSMRISANGQMFDLPISKEQAALLLSKITPQEPEPPAPPSPEEMNLFAQFTSDVGMEYDDEYSEDDDL